MRATTPLSSEWLMDDSEQIVCGIHMDMQNACNSLVSVSHACVCVAVPSRSETNCTLGLCKARKLSARPSTHATRLCPCHMPTSALLGLKVSTDRIVRHVVAAV